MVSCLFLVKRVVEMGMGASLAACIVRSADQRKSEGRISASWLKFVADHITIPDRSVKNTNADIPYAFRH
jgi:hypothetical protein